MPNDQTNEETPMGRRFRAARLNPANVIEWFTLKTERRRKRRAEPFCLRGRCNDWTQGPAFAGEGTV